MSFGVMGGNMQPQAACDAPRWRFNEGLSINVEAAMPRPVVAGLAALGHRVEMINDSYQDFGAGLSAGFRHSPHPSKEAS